jgi:hypothetical protein
MVDFGPATGAGCREGHPMPVTTRLVLTRLTRERAQNDPLDEGTPRRDARAGLPTLMRTRPATNGEYLFDAIPAGDYLLAVFGDIHPRDWQDASFLASLSAQAVRVPARAGQRATQDVRIAR